MLTFLLGRSGSGKTEYIYNALESLIANGKDKLYFLIPEQSSFETERILLEKFGPKNSCKVTVLSFRRLADTVLRKIGNIAGSRLDDGCKHVLMSMALEQVQDKLQLYSEKTSRPDMTETMIKTVQRLKLRNIPVEKLAEASGIITDEILKKKLADTSLTASAYEALIARSYIDPADDLTKVYKSLLDNDLFCGATVFVDSFSGFTMQEINVLEQLMVQSENIYVSLCKSVDDDDCNIFDVTESTMSRLKNTAERNGVCIADDICFENQLRTDKKDIAAVEKGVLRDMPEQYTGDVQNVSVYCATDIYAEADYVARNIRRLVIDEGYRYRDIAVVSRTMQQYDGVIDVVFNKYDIPFFDDNRIDVASSSLMLLAQSALDVVNNGFSAEYLMRYLKTGLTDNTPEDIAQIENYMLMWGLKGSELLKKFTAHPQGFGREENEESNQELEKLNKIRLHIINPLADFKSKIKSTDGISIARALYELLEEINVRSNICNICLNLIENNNILNARDLNLLWDILVKCLDSMAETVGEIAISPVRFAELFKLVLSCADMGSLPKSKDIVTLGTADRVRLDSTKIVFIIGAADGEFPMPPMQDSTFSPMECELLKEVGIDLYDSVQDISSLEAFFAYSAIASAKEKLFLSWGEMTLSGECKKPSVLITDMFRILPNLNLLHDENFTAEETLWAEQPAFEKYATMQQGSSIHAVLEQHFKNSDKYKKILNELERVRLNKPHSFDTAENAKKLFKNSMTISPSQAEKFYMCRFMYYCMYGIKAKERRKAELDYMEYGSLMHGIMEKLFSLDKDLAEMTDNEIKLAIDSITDDYVNTYMGGFDDKTPRFKHLCNRLKLTACRLAQQMAQEFRVSKFRPDALEMNVGKGGEIPALKVNLPDGGSVSVVGKIDRVDTYLENGVNYVRVIDYKTGSKEFRLADVIHGLNMQMLLYLSAVSENGADRYGKTVPAGILYMPAAIPNKTVSPNLSDSDLEKEITDKLRMNGLLINDEQILDAMENGLHGVFIPVVLKGRDEDDNPVYNSKSLVSTAQLGSIFGTINDLIADMASELKKGNIQNVPVKGRYDACTYCPYNAVCGYENGDEIKIIDSKETFVLKGGEADVSELDS